MRGPGGGEVRWLGLPWLDLELAFDGDGLAGETECALEKFARAAPGESGAWRLRAGLTLSAPRPESARVREAPNLRYQFVSGRVEASRAAFATRDGSLLELDLERGALTGWITREVFTAPYSTWPDLLAAPLGEGWRRHGCFPLHAGAIALAGRAVLLPAGSGSGKTTLALALARSAGATWLADDKLLLAPRDGRLLARSLYRNANLHPRTVAALAGLGRVLERPPLDETNPKRAVAQAELGVPVSFVSFRPGAVAFPVVSDRERSRLEPLSRTATLVELLRHSPTSPLASCQQEQIAALAAVARDLPAIRLVLGRDLLAAPERTAEALARELVAL